MLDVSIIADVVYVCECKLFKFKMCKKRKGLKGESEKGEESWRNNYSDMKNDQAVLAPSLF